MDSVIHLTARLRCAPAEAFAHFIDNKLLEAWLTNLADVEPRLAAKYELFWNPADRENDSTIGCRLTAIDHPVLLAFEWKSPKQFKPRANSADPLKHVVVSLSPHPPGTKVNLVTPAGGVLASSWKRPGGRNELGRLPSLPSRRRSMAAPNNSIEPTGQPRRLEFEMLSKSWLAGSSRVH